MLSFLRGRAAWFVLAGWVLLPLTILWTIGESAVAAVNAFYHPQHRGAPLDRFMVQTRHFVPAISLAAAVASSVLFTLKLRLAASVALVGCYSALFVGVAGARLLVEPGPEHFTRYVGTERFSVPWQYAPRGGERPSEAGFGLSVRLCLSNLRGTYDQHCRNLKHHQVSIRASAYDFEGIFGVRFWRNKLSEMKAGPVRDGHKSYSHTLPPVGELRYPTSQYLARYDKAGRLNRLVKCTYRLCKHHARVRDYVLSYHAEDAAFSEWQSMDRKLADLIDSWRER